VSAAPVDVLAVMGEAAAHRALRDAYEASVPLRDAIAAVRELIEAADAVGAYYGHGSDEHPLARLARALAKVGAQ
jgi:thiamine pyrophosphate-dependent acetolactate synthase large subunit-like protein